MNLNQDNPRFTRQGVLDLDGKQSNQRRRTSADGCFHEWKHSAECPCQGIYYDICEGMEECGRCGKTRYKGVR